MALTLLQHSLGIHYLNTLRRETTGLAEFRQSNQRMAELLAAEATRDLPMKAATVTTPLEELSTLAPEETCAIVGILRAGLGLVDAFTRLLPTAPVGLIGMERNEATAQATAYYRKLPPLRDRTVFVLDPMLATGGSAEDTLTRVLAEQPAEVRFVCVVAAPEGVGRLEAKFPEVEILAGALDRELNSRKFILPGLGDYGDRLFGTS